MPTGPKGGKRPVDVIGEQLCGPDVIADEGDMLPSERRDMGKKLIRNDFAARTQFVDGAAEFQRMMAVTARMC